MPPKDVRLGLQVVGRHQDMKPCLEKEKQDSDTL